MGSHQETYLLIGAGVFGVSTAIHLALAKPQAKIILLDRTHFPNPSSASHDINKIIRADYADIFYMKLALEALPYWRKDPVYSPFYHQPGYAFVENMGLGRATIQNYRSLQCDDVVAEILNLEDARVKWGGLFEKANWKGGKECFWNPKSGWADAEGALASATLAALERGVEYHEGTIAKLEIDDVSGACLGAHTTRGDFLSADYVVLCTGAGTARLLADSAPKNEQLQVGERLVAAGAVSCTAKVTTSMKESFHEIPVFFNGLGHTQGEVVPSYPSTSLLKINYELSFTHLTTHLPSCQRISTPPPLTPHSTWGHSVPTGLKLELASVVRNMYGQNLEIQEYRMCWDAVTPTQDFLIAPHPASKGLFLATGGSFHGFKFLPVIGKYVVQMLDGTLKEDAKWRWRWRENSGKGDEEEGGACAMYIPKRDLSDVEGWKELVGVEAEFAINAKEKSWSRMKSHRNEKGQGQY